MAVRSSVLLLASAAMAVSRVAAYAVVDIDALADLAVAGIAAPVANAAVADASEPVSTIAATRVSAVSAAASASAPAASGMDGCVHVQVVHSTNVQHFDKRAVQLSLANRSDVAYYAKCRFFCCTASAPTQLTYSKLWDAGAGAVCPARHRLL